VIGPDFVADIIATGWAWPVTKLGMLREPSGRVRYLTDDEEGRLMKTLSTEAGRQRVTVLL
jgi:hypothetical protein